jgi:hypothetical protein
MPDESERNVVSVFAGETDLIQGELSVLVEHFLRWDARAGFVVVNLDRSVAGSGDAVDDALHLVFPGIVERKDDALLDPQGFIFVERVVASVVSAQTLLPELTIEGEGGAFANDADPFPVVGLFPEFLVSVDDLFDARDLASSD